MHPAADVSKGSYNGSACVQVLAEGLAACTLAERCTPAKQVGHPS